MQKPFSFLFAVVDPIAKRIYVPCDWTSAMPRNWSFIAIQLGGYIRGGRRNVGTPLTRGQASPLIGTVAPKHIALSQRKETQAFTARAKDRTLAVALYSAGGAETL